MKKKIGLFLTTFLIGLVFVLGFSSQKQVKADSIYGIDFYNLDFYDFFTDPEYVDMRFIDYENHQFTFLDGETYNVNPINYHDEYYIEYYFKIYLYWKFEDSYVGLYTDFELTYYLESDLYDIDYISGKLYNDMYLDDYTFQYQLDNYIFMDSFELDSIELYFDKASIKVNDNNTLWNFVNDLDQIEFTYNYNNGNTNITNNLDYVLEFTDNLLNYMTLNSNIIIDTTSLTEAQKEALQEYYFQQGYQQAISDIGSVDTEAIYNQGFSDGVNNEKLLNGSNTIFTNIFNGLGNFLTIEIFPNISIGTIIFIPIFLGLFVIIIKLLRG